MARVVLPVTNPPGKYPVVPLAALSADITWTAADVVNKEQVALTGREIVLAWNTDAGAQTVTINSSPDPQSRTADIAAYSIGAGLISGFGPFPLEGWAQGDGTLHLEASSANVKFAVLRLPALN
jgi:hypothetical protein